MNGDAFKFNRPELINEPYHRHCAAAQELLQRNCGGFLACLDAFQKAVPKDFADKCLLEIHKSFLGK